MPKSPMVTAVRSASNTGSDDMENRYNESSEDLETNSATTRFVNHQSSLNKVEAIKQSKWPLAWCKT